MNAKLTSVFVIVVSVAWGFSSEAFAFRGWCRRNRVTPVRYTAAAVPRAETPHNEKTPEPEVTPDPVEASTRTGRKETPDQNSLGNSPGKDQGTGSTANAGSEEGTSENTTPAGSSGNDETSRRTGKTPDRESLCDTQRQDIPSGARVTLFANFLRHEAGVVMFEIGGTSFECRLIDWQPDSVTVDLPLLGLTEPKNAAITIVLPDGRIAKTFKVRYVRQPDIVQHEESVPQPMLPVPAMAAPANYVVAVQGGFTLYGD